jgi:hypothetical protein
VGAMADPNALRWDGAPGHYEVWYITATDPASGVGLWLRFTLRAALAGGGECALWCLAMQRDGTRFARKATFALDRLEAERAPFRLRLAGAELSDRGSAGEIGDDCAWELSWTPRLPAAPHVHPLLRRARLARTEVVVVHPVLALSGTMRLGERALALDGAGGGQAHVWGSGHAARWAWAHASDLRGLDGAARPDTYVDAVSAYVRRGGRELGPSTAVVGRVLGDDFAATSPVRVATARSRFGLTSWDFRARDGARRLEGAVDAPRASLAGVTYHDPDGTPAYCYNSEVASLRLVVRDRAARGRPGWIVRDTLVADGRAHCEYGQRAPVPGVELLLP